MMRGTRSSSPEFSRNFSEPKPIAQKEKLSEDNSNEEEIELLSSDVAIVFGPEEDKEIKALHREALFSDIEQIIVYNNYYVTKDEQGKLIGIPIQEDSVVGKGGFGKVHIMSDPNTGKGFALKVQNLAKKSNLVTNQWRALEEAKVLGKFANTEGVLGIEGFGYDTPSELTPEWVSATDVYFKMPYAGEDAAKRYYFITETANILANLEKKNLNPEKERAFDVLKFVSKFIKSKKIVLERLLGQTNKTPDELRQQAALEGELIDLDLQRNHATEILREDILEIKKEFVIDTLKKMRSARSGLNNLHKEKIVHNDIKPANVTVDSGENEKYKGMVIDLGLIRKEGEEVLGKSGTTQYFDPARLMKIKGAPSPKFHRSNDQRAFLQSQINVVLRSLDILPLSLSEWAFNTNDRFKKQSLVERQLFHAFIYDYLFTQTKDKNGEKIFDESLGRNLSLGKKKPYTKIKNVRTELYPQRLTDDAQRKLKNLEFNKADGKITAKDYDEAYNEIWADNLTLVSEALIDSTEKIDMFAKEELSNKMDNYYYDQDVILDEFEEYYAKVIKFFR